MGRERGAGGSNGGGDRWEEGKEEERGGERKEVAEGVFREEGRERNG